MSETAYRPLTVKAARRLLSDTRRASADQLAAAEGLIRDLHSRKPTYLQGGGTCVVHCLACGNATWSLHSDGEDEVWACDQCHRPPMSSEEAWALKDAQREQAARLKAEAKAVADAAPSPRKALAAIANELAEAQAEEGRLEAAAANARDQLAGARVALDAAEEALTIARAKIAEATVNALLDPTGATKKPRTAGAEIAALDAARAGLELATTASQTIEDMLGEVRYQLRKLIERHRTAALNVLSDECGPLFIARATEARTEFVMASKGLQWLALS